MNKEGCPRCGSVNIAFRREAKEQVSKKNRTQIVRTTVGLCKDCGHTWQPTDESAPAVRKTWLWVLGWIFVFPVPLTVILLKKKEMASVLRYALIAIAWIAYLAIALSGYNAETDAQKTPPPEAETQMEAVSMVLFQEENGFFLSSLKASIASL